MMPGEIKADFDRLDDNYSKATWKRVRERLSTFVEVCDRAGRPQVKTEVEKFARVVDEVLDV